MIKNNFSNNKLFYFVIILLLSCNSNSKSSLDHKVEVIEIRNNEKFKLGDFIDRIEYYLLADDLSMGFVDKVFAHEDLLVLCDFFHTYSILILDENLEIFGQINNFGEGPGEYNYIKDVTINKESNTIDVLALNKIIRFDFKGNFLNEFKTTITFSKFQHHAKDSYIVYVPSGYNEAFLRKELLGHILFNWDARLDVIEPIIPQYYEKGLPMTTERSMLRKVNDDYYFSMTFSDTIYCLDKNNNIKMKYYLDFNKKQLPVELLYKREIHEVLNDKEFRRLYNFQQTNLQVSDKYLITNYIENGRFSPIIYSRNSKLAFTGPLFSNDIDQGINYLEPKAIHNNIIYAIQQPDAFLNHYGNNEENLKKVENNFTKMARSLDINSSLIVSKYYLK